MSQRADELFTKNFIKFVEANGRGALGVISPLHQPRVDAFLARFRKEASRKLLILHDAALVPDTGIIVAHHIDSKGYGLAASTTGFMCIDKNLRCDFIHWSDCIDLMDYFSKENRPKLGGWLATVGIIWFVYIDAMLINKGSDLNTASERMTFWTGVGTQAGAALDILVGTLLLLIAAPAVIWAVRLIFGPKILYFGHPSRFWSGAWFLDRDRVFSCLRRGGLIWEKAHDIEGCTSSGQH